MTDLPPDPMVRRVNQLTTTFLDTLAILLFAGAAGWSCWRIAPWVGLFAAACAVSILSILAQLRSAPKAPVPVERDDEDDLPGPADPGNLHVMGR